MGRCDGMVDVADSKSAGGNTVWVRLPPPAPRRKDPLPLRFPPSRQTAQDGVLSPFSAATRCAGLAAEEETGSDVDCSGAPQSRRIFFQNSSASPMYAGAVQSEFERPLVPVRFEWNGAHGSRSLHGVSGCPRGISEISWFRRPQRPRPGGAGSRTQRLRMSRISASASSGRVLQLVQNRTQWRPSSRHSSSSNAYFSARRCICPAVRITNCWLVQLSM